MRSNLSSKYFNHSLITDVVKYILREVGNDPTHIRGILIIVERVMKISLIFLLVFLFSILNLAGCSSNKSNPVIPENQDNGLDLPFIESDQTLSDHQLLGSFTATFNIESPGTADGPSACGAGVPPASSAVAPTASVTPTRHPLAHHNITDLIPTPLITINSWDPISETIDIGIQLHNPTWTSVYDVRLIIFTDPAGHLLTNDDNWTPLWDIPLGQIANPFKAYAKNQPNRIFTGETFHSENFKIKCPNNNFSIQFAIDASFPDNCEDPYEIRNFEQGFLFENTGSSTTISLDILDWQEDVSSVKLSCQQITGQPEIELA